VIETYRSTGTVSQHPAKYGGPLGNPSSHINVLDNGLRQSVSYTVGENRVVVLRCTRGRGGEGGQLPASPLTGFRKSLLWIPSIERISARVTRGHQP
jgi:hypothetical protein